MTDEESARELVVGHWIDGELMTEEIELIAQAFDAVRRETVERCAKAVRALEAGHESTDANIGIEMGLAMAEQAIRALPDATPAESEKR
jgi:hypothetical protein